jgi:hypothetical protein
VKALAWSCFAATAVLGVVHGVLVLTGTAGLVGPDTGLNSFPIITAGCVLGALVGAMVATRHPRNPVGWLLLAGQLGTGIGLVANAYAHRVLHDGELGPRLAGQLAVVVDSALGATWALSILAAVFLLFPDGSLPSARWRPVLWALPVPNVGAVLSTVLFVRTDTITGIGDGWAAVSTSVELDPIVPLAGVTAAVLSALLLLLSVMAMAQRTWRARGELRQQMRWLTTAAGALVAGLVLAQLGWLGGEVAQVWGLVPLFVAYAGVPVAAGVAILRYRLYDIDIVINRAVVGAVVVTFVTVGYVVVVVSLGAVVGGRAGDGYWESVVATALVALAFQPLRRGVQRLGDRAVHGRRAAPYQALADLSRRLARAVSPDQVLPGVADAAGAQPGRPHRHGPAGCGRGRRRGRPLARRRHTDRRRAHRAGAARRAGARRDRGDPAGRAPAVEGRPDAAPRPRHPGRTGHAQRPARGAATRGGGSGGRAGRRAGGLPAAAARRPGVRTAAAEAGDQHGGAPAPDPHPPLLAPPSAVTERCLDDAVGLVNQALEAPRDIARGVFPPILAHKGLGAALRLYAGRSGGRVELVVPPRAQAARFAPHIEAVTYFCAVETVRGLGGAARIHLDVDGGPSS